MVSLALAAAIVAAQPWQPQSGVSVQATATVRIVAGERVRLGEFGHGGDSSLPAPRKAEVAVEGTQTPAWLDEFP